MARFGAVHVPDHSIGTRHDVKGKAVRLGIARIHNQLHEARVVATGLTNIPMAAIEEAPDKGNGAARISQVLSTPRAFLV